ncbi:hypothetical protein SISNIDRAFT_424333 [Sistotremastrum niveocremeum HHB9708]|uniref:Uncharacterized protein n=1 Tax=Sistotremastrum niveocremeum HHB9708 TaxID=1314777 RepID=A0A164YB98_9AGAM|nr:hypothetical protein SISNIDRAFT_424333 [Sistotremastrum niveocremeum HHB9708]
MYFRGRTLWGILCLFSVFTLSSLNYFYELHKTVRDYIPGYRVNELRNDSQVSSTIPSHLSLPLQPGPVTAKFRDALLPDHKYITTFPDAGWTNDVMNTAHLLVLSFLTRRTPILPPFHPSHVGREAGIIPFSDVFDIDRLSRAMNIPILEWHQIKNTSDEEHYANPATRGYYGGEKEELGCWTVWPSQRADGASPRGRSSQTLSLDISWTPVPFVPYPRTPGIDWSITALANLGYSSAPLPDKIPWPNSLGNQIDPDDQLSCFDFIYYIRVDTGNPWWDESGMFWNTVGTHMHWTPLINSIARNILNDLLDISSPPVVPLTQEPTTPMPQYIAIHARRGDFARVCAPYNREDCLPSVAILNRRVSEIRLELEDKGFRNTDALKVVLLTDEPHTSESFWEDATSLGWLWVDHERYRTEELYGKWFPMLVDACLQSSAVGFVGTEGSTMSNIARRRVIDWSGGAGTMVRWGNPTADNH